MKKNFLFCLPLAICLCMCKNAKWKDPSSHAVSFVTVAPGVKLEVLDWGGKGEPILFLAGLGNTGHIFDEYAPQFTDHFHVLAVSRRGFGASSQPSTGYDPGTFAHDILELINNLKIDRVTLIGHSIAGEEMTKFASLYPSRINKLIYLDAAYDRVDSDSIFKNVPPPPPPTTNDSASLKTVQGFFQRVYDVKINESDIRASTIFAEDGKVIRDITKDSTYAAIISSIEHPNYKAIQAPSLAFYGVPDSIRDLFTFYDLLDSSGRKTAVNLFPIAMLNTRRQIDRFKKEVSNGKVIELHRANHYVFISNPREVTSEIRKFLEVK